MGLFDSLLNIATLGLVTTPEQRQEQRANNAATDLAQTQANQYQNLYQTGQGLSNVGQNPLLGLYQTGQTTNPLYQQFGQAAGINFGGQATPPGYIPGTPGGGFTNGAPNVARVGGPQGTGVNPAGSPAQGANAQTGVNTGGGQNAPTNPAWDAYGLTQPQQIQLNQQIHALTQHSQSAISQYQARMQQQGVSPSMIAEGAARLQQQAQATQAGLVASFAEAARASREQALQALLTQGQNAFTGQQQLGLNLQQNATAGLTNPQGAQNQLAQQAAAKQSANLGSLLQLGTQFLPGGAFAGGGLFGGGAAPILSTVGGNSQTPGVADLPGVFGYSGG